MKRFGFILLLACLGTGLMANSPVNFGLNFRLNMPKASYESADWDQFFEDMSGASSVNGYTDVIDNSMMGYAGGIFLRFNGRPDSEGHGGKGFLHSEAMFSFNSTEMESHAVDRPGEALTITTESTVFNVPIYLGRNLINSSVFKLRVMTGPSLEWNINTTTTGHREGVDVSDVHNDIEKNDFNWYWGVGAGLELFMLSFDARYCVDMNAVSSSSAQGSSYTQRTNMVEFTLGFKIF